MELSGHGDFRASLQKEHSETKNSAKLLMGG
jgi:hypothetical protein